MPAVRAMGPGGLVVSLSDRFETDAPIAVDYDEKGARFVAYFSGTRTLSIPIDRALLKSVIRATEADQDRRWVVSVDSVWDTKLQSYYDDELGGELGRRLLEADTAFSTAIEGGLLATVDPVLAPPLPGIVLKGLIKGASPESVEFQSQLLDNWPAPPISWPTLTMTVAPPAPDGTEDMLPVALALDPQPRLLAANQRLVEASTDTERRLLDSLYRPIIDDVAKRAPWYIDQVSHLKAAAQLASVFGSWKFACSGGATGKGCAKVRKAVEQHRKALQPTDPSEVGDDVINPLEESGELWSADLYSYSLRGSRKVRTALTNMWISRRLERAKVEGDPRWRWLVFIDEVAFVCPESKLSSEAYDAMFEIVRDVPAPDSVPEYWGAGSLALLEACRRGSASATLALARKAASRFSSNGPTDGAAAEFVAEMEQLRTTSARLWPDGLEGSPTKLLAEWDRIISGISNQSSKTSASRFAEIEHAVDEQLSAAEGPFWRTRGLEWLGETETRGVAQAAGKDADQRRARLIANLHYMVGIGELVSGDRKAAEDRWRMLVSLSARARFERAHVELRTRQLARRLGRAEPRDGASMTLAEAGWTVSEDGTLVGSVGEWPLSQYCMADLPAGAAARWSNMQASLRAHLESNSLGIESIKLTGYSDHLPFRADAHLAEQSSCQGEPSVSAPTSSVPEESALALHERLGFYRAASLWHSLLDGLPSHRTPTQVPEVVGAWDELPSDGAKANGRKVWVRIVATQAPGS